MSEGNGHVALVLVSHSAAIAEGLADLISQVAGPDVAIHAAGGGPDGTLGTDGGRILDALQAASEGAGAVVLMDLGSSILSVRAALAELPPDRRQQLAVVDAPLVEGAVAAAVTASTGATRGETARAAEEARVAVKF